MIILGIETSCDETAASLVDDKKTILAQRVFSQLKDHAVYGGVVPEIAARAHGAILPGMVRDLLNEANISWDQIDGIAATTGPGLIGGLLVGATFGKALAFAHQKPFLAVNHLEAHALTCRLTDDVEFPYLMLLVSGGHTQLLSVSGVGRYELLGTTLDDAAGECFDKGAKLMGLGWPGGPLVEQQAKLSQNPHRFALPRPMLGRAGCDFSFSGLKTAVRQAVQKNFDTADIPDLCASFQNAIADSLIDRCRNAMRIFKERNAPSAFVAAGGVAANRFLRQRLNELCAAENFTLVAPPVSLCTDNGVMIAFAGIEKLRLGQTDSLNSRCRPRWPLAELTRE